MSTEHVSETKLRTETPTGYLDFSLEIAAQWLDNNATEAMEKIVDPSVELVKAVAGAQWAVKHARMVLAEHSKRVYVELPERASPAAHDSEEDSR
jgi:hypothetical protein